MRSLFTALFVAGSHSLKPKILKAFNPSQSDRPFCCVSVLSPRCCHAMTHCVFSKCPSVLCGRHAALLSCIHIGLLTVRTGGCCSPDTFFFHSSRLGLGTEPVVESKWDKRSGVGAPTGVQRRLYPRGPLSSVFLPDPLEVHDRG